MKVTRKAKTYIKGVSIRGFVLMALMGLLCVATPNGLNTSQTVLAATSSSSFSNLEPTFSITKRTAKNVVLKINLVDGATQYNVYRSTSKSGTYTYIGRTLESTYTDVSTTASKAYYYKVQAVSKQAKSKKSQAVKVYANLAKVTGVTAKPSGSQITLSWSKVNGAKKYRVYRSTSLNGEYDYIGYSTSNIYQDSDINTGKTYYYKVLAYKKSSGIAYYGSYSAKVSGTMTSGNGITDTSTESYIAEVLRLINVERAKENLSALTTTSALKSAAYGRAVEIKQVFSHTRPNGSSCFSILGDYNITYMAAGENIAYGQKTPEAVVESWMNSKGHRDNIMSNNFGKVGIGCYNSGGTYYWSQLFTN